MPSRTDNDQAGADPGPRLSAEVNTQILKAHDIASQRGETHSDVGHLLLAVIGSDDGVIVDELHNRGIDVSALKTLTWSALPQPPKSSIHGSLGSTEGTVQVTSAFMKVLDDATKLASDGSDYEVDELHLMRAMASLDHPATEPLRERIDDPRPFVANPSRAASASRSLSKLAQYGRLLTDEAREGRLDPVIGRVSELERLVHVLGRRRKNNPVLLGEPGVGKTAIVEGLAQAIADSRVPSAVAGRHIFALDVGSLVAGTKYRGEFETRIQELLGAIRSSDGGIILFIDELHLIARAGGAEGAIDAAGFLKPMLARGELHAIGATTIADYRDRVVRDGALERRFQPIYVEQPSDDEALAMLRGLRHAYEAHHGVSISDSALESAVEESRLRIPYRNLPDKAIDLIDEASSRKRAVAEGGFGQSSSPAGPDDLEVTAADVEKVLGDWVGAKERDWSRGVYDESGHDAVEGDPTHG